MEAFRRGRLVYPPSPYRYNKEAVEAIQNGQMEQAQTLLIQALKMNPSYAPALVNLAFLKASLSDYENAEMLLLEALREDPKIWRAHYNLGILYLKRGEKKKARREFQAELSMDPEFAPAREALENLKQEP